MVADTAIAEITDPWPLCWICHERLKCRAPPKTATGLCQRCYSREYQRAMRTKVPMVRTPDDARSAGRVDLLEALANLPLPVPRPPTRRQLQAAERQAASASATSLQDGDLQAALATIVELQYRVARLQSVAEAARSWWRGPFLSANVVRLKAAVEAWNRSEGLAASRALDDD